MNRRGFFIGSVAAPLAVAAAVQAKPKTATIFVGGVPQCSKCLGVMYVEAPKEQDWKETGVMTVTTTCTSYYCENRNKPLRFNVPTIQAVEVPI